MSGGVDPSMLPVVRAADLDEPEPDKKWLIEHLWARAGVGFISGPPKTCKSWLGLDAALSVASATPCLDTFEVRDPGSVMIYLAEDAASVVKERLLGLCRHRGIDLGRQPIDVITAPSLRLDLPRDQRRLLETVRRRRPRLLLLDPFVRLHRIDENHAGDVSAVLGYLRELQRSQDLAVAVVHHARKNGGSGSGGQSLRGSGDFFAWVDSALSLRRQQQRLVLTVEHRAAVTPPPISVVLRAEPEWRDAHLAACLDDDPKDGAVEHDGAAPDTAILAMLTTALVPITRDALRAALRIRNARLGDALSRLLAAGKITRRDDGWLLNPVPVPAS